MLRLSVLFAAGSVAGALAGGKVALCAASMDWEHMDRLAESDAVHDVLVPSTADAQDAAKLRQPIVLCHGYLGFDVLAMVNGRRFVEYFAGVPDALRACGARVIVTRVDRLSSVAVRAEQIRVQLDADRAATGYAGRYNLIAHSMGGLDARQLAASPGGSAYVASITTVGTPHHGSPFADYILDLLGADEARVALAERMLALLGVTTAGLRDLATAACARFNATVADSPTVRYFSIGSFKAVSALHPLYPSYRVVLAAEGRNDGLVSLRSARWGAYLGSLADTDHLDQVGLGAGERATRAPALYVHIAARLAREGL